MLGTDPGVAARLDVNCGVGHLIDQKRHRIGRVIPRTLRLPMAGVEEDVAQTYSHMCIPHTILLGRRWDTDRQGMRPIAGNLAHFQAAPDDTSVRSTKVMQDVAYRQSRENAAIERGLVDVHPRWIGLDGTPEGIHRVDPFIEIDKLLMRHRLRVGKGDATDLTQFAFSKKCAA